MHLGGLCDSCCGFVTGKAEKCRTMVPMTAAWRCRSVRAILPIIVPRFRQPIFSFTAHSVSGTAYGMSNGNGSLRSYLEKGVPETYPGIRSL